MNLLAGLRPILSPTPIKNGLKYKVAPVPYGGTKSSFALTTCMQASINFSTGTSGISNLLQLLFNLSAFLSGLNSCISPFLVLYAFNPSKHCWP